MDDNGNKEKTALSRRLFLGGVDANALLYKELSPFIPEVEDAMTIRRNLMQRLLLWERIVFSDSQMLNNPSIRDLTNAAKEMNCTDPSKPYYWQQGLEQLVEAGMVEIASREKNGQPIGLYQVWRSMSERKSHVPNLPENGDYAIYMDGIRAERMTFRGGDAGRLFKENLYGGIAYFSGYKDLASIDVNPDCAEDRELVEIMEKDSVLFSELLEKMILQYRTGRITLERLYEWYRYVYSCYCINVPLLTDTFVELKRDNIPLHMDAGMGDFLIEPDNADYSRLKPSFSVNPQVMDYLPFDAFIDVRKNLEDNYINKDLMFRYNTGQLTEADWKGEFPDFWNDFTHDLEWELRMAVSTQLNKELLAKVPEYHPYQETVVKNGLEFVRNTMVDHIPGISDVKKGYNMWQTAKDKYVTFSNRHLEANSYEKRRVLEDLTNRRTKYITRFDRNRFDGR